MLASHDSYTFQKPKNILLSLISIFWRCQKLDITNQYKLGVRVFDIRVYRNKNNKWGTAHGLAKFDIAFNTLSELCRYFKELYTDSIIRIILEDNVNDNKELLELFLEEADIAFGRYKDMIWEIGTHLPWIIYYKNKDFTPEIKEYYCHLFNWNPDRSISYNIKNFDWSSWCLPLYSKKHNPIITKDMLEDKNTMHILDYIGVY